MVAARWQFERSPSRDLGRRKREVAASEAIEAEILAITSKIGPGRLERFTGESSRRLEHFRAYLLAQLFDLDEPAFFSVLERLGLQPRDVSDILADVAIPASSTRASRPQARRSVTERGLLIAQQELADSGGALDAANLACELPNTSPDEINAMVADRAIFFVSASNGDVLFPRVQFRNGRPLPGLADLIKVFPTNNGWALLNFLVNSSSDLNGTTPAEALIDHKLEAVLASVRLLGKHSA